MPEKTNKAGLNGSKIAVLLILGFVNAIMYPICQICIL